MAESTQQETEAKALLTEVRQRIFFDIDEDGMPKSSIAEILDMWTRVNDCLA